jgi:putative ABC transport system substrate-binding protein
MHRRTFITGLVGAAIGSTAATAQQAVVPVIGFLNTASQDAFANLVQAFRNGLAEAGYVEGKNVLIDYRWANGLHDRLPDLAADLVRRRVSVIAATGGSPAAVAAKAATATIPIVFQTGVDPVEIGLVESLSKPGGNVTGATMIADQLGPKRLEILREIVPDAKLIGAIFNPASPSSSRLNNELMATARLLGLQVHVVHVRSDQEFEAAFAELKKAGVGALIMVANPLFNGQSEKLAELTMRHKVPSIYQFREFAAAGGLMSYGGSITDAYHQAGAYTGRILNGDKPANLPVQQSTKVEFFINLKTARALGLTIPLPLLGRADEVIE